VLAEFPVLLGGRFRERWWIFLEAIVPDRVLSDFGTYFCKAVEPAYCSTVMSIAAAISFKVLIYG